MLNNLSFEHQNVKVGADLSGGARKTTQVAYSLLHFRQIKSNKRFKYEAAWVEKENNKIKNKSPVLKLEDRFINL